MVVDLSKGEVTPTDTSDMSELDLEIMYKRLQIIEKELELACMRSGIQV